MAKDKNQYVDLLKGISCIIVVCLHCPFPGVLGDGIIYGLRFSVPVFFLVSGYFSFSKSDRWIINKAVYILKLLVFTELFYGIWSVFRDCVIHKNTLGYIVETYISGKNIIEVIFCGTLFNGTIWYLYAMFWTWVFIWVLRRKQLINKVFFLVPLLLLVQIGGRYYVQNHCDIDKWIVLFRNAVTVGIPFTLLGVWIATNKVKLLEKISINKNRFIILSGFCLIVIEFLITGQYMDLHISTVIIAFGLFLYAIRQNTEVTKYLAFFIRIGSVWYVWIYLLHIWVSGVLKEIYIILQIEDNKGMQYLFPVLVCICSCICSELIEKLRSKRLKCMKNKGIK